MKTIKFVFMSVIVVSFIFGLWLSQSGAGTEQIDRKLNVASIKRFVPLQSDAVTGSDVRNQAANTSTQSPKAPTLHILFTSNRLSVEVSSHPLQGIVDKIAQQSGITIVLSEAIQNPLTTIQFHDLSIEQGLNQLFKNYDTFFFYTRDDGGSARLANVWVYPRGQGKNLAPTSPPNAVYASAMMQDTMDTDSVKRASAIVNLIEQQGSGAADIIQNALTDPDENIRIQTLDAALRAQIDLPLDTLIDLAHNDASAKIRSIALAGIFSRLEKGLVKTSDILDLLIIAQKDSDTEVSELADQFLQSLEETTTEHEEESQEQLMDP